MPIRSRVKVKTRYAGYPGPKFLGYCLRFGEVNAAFASAMMQFISGDCVKPKGNPPATITFYTRAALYHEVEARDALGVEFEAMLEVADEWPRKSDTLSAMPHKMHLYD